MPLLQEGHTGYSPTSLVQVCLSEKKPHFVLCSRWESRRTRFFKRVEVLRRWTRNKAVYREAFFEGNSLLIVRSGIGPTRAAAAVQGLEILPSAILSVGTAGGLASDSRIRDIVVASEIVFKDQPDDILKCSEELVRAAASACSSEGLRFRIARIVTSSKADNKQLRNGINFMS